MGKRHDAHSVGTPDLSDMLYTYWANRTAQFNHVQEAQHVPDLATDAVYRRLVEATEKARHAIENLILSAQENSDRYKWLSTETMEWPRTRVEIEGTVNGWIVRVGPKYEYVSYEGKTLDEAIDNARQLGVKACDKCGAWTSIPQDCKEGEV